MQREQRTENREQKIRVPVHLRAQRGVTTLLVIAFMGIFLLVVSVLTSYAFQEARYGRALYGREQALAIAEGGLEYYRWFLGHDPGDLTNGTGLPGPYTYVVNDPEGGTIGSALITVVGNQQCGVTQSIDITSKGTADLNPGFPRTLFARYMQKSVAWYSYLLNSKVHAGSDRIITGPYFSNGGIRMDGTNLSDVLSAVSTWVCNSSYGCSPTQNNAPGVVGNGSGSALWRYPAASIDFNVIAANLTNLKTYAQSNGGLYFAPAPGAAIERGYHLVFQSAGTVDVYRVSATTVVWGYPDGAHEAEEYNIIAAQTFLGTYTIPSSCSLIFVDDRAWIEGTVKGKVTVVAATPDTSTTPDAILSGNINYDSYDGSNGITVIAEANILIPLNSPEIMTLHGIYVAQNGYYGRNHYTTTGQYKVPSPYDSFVIQTQLTTVGSIVSSGRTGTRWTSGGVVSSGYQTRIDSYDELQATNPPPFTPAASTDYRFVLWKEQ